MKRNSFTFSHTSLYSSLSRRAVMFGMTGLIVAGCTPSPADTGKSSDGSDITPTSANTPTPAITPGPVGHTYIEYKEHKMAVGDVAWSPDGKWIASFAGEEIHIWDAVTGQTKYTLPPAPVSSLDWSPDGKYLAFAPWFGSNEIGGSPLIVWDVEANAEKISWAGFGPLAWSPDGKYIAGSGENGVILVWDARNGQHLMEYTEQSLSLFSISWSPDSTRLITSCRYPYGHAGPKEKIASVHIWERQTGNMLFSYLEEETQGSYGTAWSPDGASIAVDEYVREGDVGKTTIKVGSSSSGQISQVYQVTTSGGAVLELAWSPFDNHIAVACGSPQQPLPGVVDVRDIGTGQSFIYREHTDAVLALAWSPDGKRIASTSRDNTVRIWQAV